MGWIVYLGLAAAVMLVFAGYPYVFKRAKKSEMTEPTSNVRQLFLALFEFDAKYGSYPSSLTIPQVMADSGTALTLGDDSSNELFKQLFAAKMVDSERLFHAPGPGHRRRPDNEFGSDATALAKGECSFAYISGLSSDGDPSRPIVFGPILPGTRSLNRKIYDDKAIVLKLDGSAAQVRISPSGKIIIDGMDMLDPKHPIWDGKPFTVKWPK